MGFLRKRTPADSSSTSPSSRSPNRKSLRPSLSLPDLTTPLLDPASWEEVPLSVPSALHELASTPARQPSSGVKRILSGGATPHSAGRNRSPSLVKAGMETGFHRPFTPWQVIPRDFASPSPQQGSGQEGSWSTGQGGVAEEWRMSGASSWTRHRDSAFTTHSRTKSQLDMARAKSRRGRSKAPGKLNVVVVGGKGVGKTSFTNLLLTSLTSPTPPPTPPDEQGLSSPIHLSPIIPEEQSPGVTLSSPTSPGPPVLDTPTITPAIGDVPRPTLRLSSRSLLVDFPETGYDKTLLRVVDTPGLEISGGGDGAAVRERERERGVQGILRLVEERFEGLLREERKVVRRKGGGEEELLHLIVYLIDARSVLWPPHYDEDWNERVDWSGVGVWDEAPQVETQQIRSANTRSEPRVSKIELDIIERFSGRANVLPVLTHVDALTISEREEVRSAMRRDVARVLEGEEGEGFGVFGSASLDERDEESSAEDDEPAQQEWKGLPFAIFVPELTPSLAGRRRAYPWGAAEVDNPAHSDFLVMRDAIFIDHAKALRTRTREVLYERYRTERLLATKANSPTGPA